MSESIYPHANGEIIEMQGRLAVVRLRNGQIVKGRFRQRESIFGNPVGWKVKIEFRCKSGDRQGLIVSWSD